MNQDLVQVLSAIANVATIAGVVFGIVGIVFIWLQVRHAILAREASTCLSLAQISGSPDFTAALQRAWSLPSDSTLSNDDREAAIKLCVFFELVGAICNYGYMSKKLIEEFYGSLVVHVYDRLQPFIAEHRKQAGRSGFARNFEMLASRLLAAGQGTAAP